MAQNRDWWLHARIGKELDGRKKLTDKERQHILELAKQGVAIREIARKYAGTCSRRLIQFIIYPERDKKLKVKAKENKVWLEYYDTDKQREYMRVHRQNIRKKYKML